MLDDEFYGVLDLGKELAPEPRTLEVIEVCRLEQLAPRGGVKAYFRTHPRAARASANTSSMGIGFT